MFTLHFLTLNDRCSLNANEWLFILGQKKNRWWLKWLPRVTFLMQAISRTSRKFIVLRLFWFSEVVCLIVKLKVFKLDSDPLFQALRNCLRICGINLDLFFNPYTLDKQKILRHFFLVIFMIFISRNRPETEWKMCLIYLCFTIVFHSKNPF